MWILFEEWKDIKGFEGLYQISSFGRVAALPKIRTNGKYYQITRRYEGKILRPGSNGDGYEIAALYKMGKRYAFQVHRLVALHFCDGFAPDLVVNHKDCNVKNNLFTNLEWCSRIENDIHAMQSPNSDKVYYPVKCRKTGKVYNSIKEARRELKIPFSENHLFRMLRGKHPNKSTIDFIKVVK